MPQPSACPLTPCLCALGRFLHLFVPQLPALGLLVGIQIDNNHYGKQYGDSVKKKKKGIKLPYDPAVPLLSIYPEEIIIEKDTPTPVFIAALFIIARLWKDFPGGTVVKNPPANTGDAGDTVNPGLGRSPGEGNSNPLQYSCLQNSMDRGAWWAIVHGVAKSQTQLSAHVRTHTQDMETT